jgi:protein-S-isoprenylcysteine O-methyltransferase Ste14
METLPEGVYRTASAVLWLTFFGLRLYYQRAIPKDLHYSHKYQQREMVYFKLFAASFFLMPLYFFPGLIDRAAFPLPWWLRWSGFLVTGAGLWLFSASHHALGKNWTAIMALSDKHNMVQSGPYAIIRHPMYTAFFIIGLGFGLMSANWLIIIIYMLPLILMVVSRVKDEEGMMIERFGEEYRAYMRKTGSLLPRWK